MVVVPIVNAIVYKKRPPPTTWLASILAVIGVGFLTLEGAWRRHAPRAQTPHITVITPHTPVVHTHTHTHIPN